MSKNAKHICKITIIVIINVVSHQTELEALTGKAHTYHVVQDLVLSLFYNVHMGGKILNRGQKEVMQ